MEYDRAVLGTLVGIGILVAILWKEPNTSPKLGFACLGFSGFVLLLGSALNDFSVQKFMGAPYFSALFVASLLVGIGVSINGFFRRT